MVCAARSAAILMLSRSSRSSRQRVLIGHQARQLPEDDVRDDQHRSQRVVQVVRDAARQNAQRLEPLGGCQPLLHAALVEHGPAQDLLVQANVAQHDGDLIAEDDVGVVARLMIERDHAQQLVLVNQREHQQRVLAIQSQHGRGNQHARRKPRRLRVPRDAVDQTDQRLQLGAGALGDARDQRRPHAGRRQRADQRVAQRRPVEGRRRLRAAFVQIQPMLHLRGGAGHRDQAERFVKRPLQRRVDLPGQVVAQHVDGAQQAPGVARRRRGRSPAACRPPSGTPRCRPPARRPGRCPAPSRLRDPVAATRLQDVGQRRLQRFDAGAHGARAARRP